MAAVSVGLFIGRRRTRFDSKSSEARFGGTSSSRGGIRPGLGSTSRERVKAGERCWRAGLELERGAVERGSTTQTRRTTGRAKKGGVQRLEEEERGPDQRVPRVTGQREGGGKGGPTGLAIYWPAQAAVRAGRSGGLAAGLSARWLASSFFFFFFSFAKPRSKQKSKIQINLNFKP